MNHKDLLAYKLSYSFALSIYKVTHNFPDHEKFGIVSQLRRASVSVSTNIAEGFARNSNKSLLNFLYISRGSLVELETLLLFARDLGYLSNEEHKNLEKQRFKAIQLLSGLIRYQKNAV